MDKSLAGQYDGFVEAFLKDHAYYNRDSRAFFYDQIEDHLNGKDVLDVACGDGQDLKHYASLGAHVTGIDASRELVSKAKALVGDAAVSHGYMEDLPYADNSFDVVLSKWAMQSSRDVPKVINEMHRVLRPGGILAYLTVHPLRQFLEKKKHPADYFQQEIVHSCFFQGTVTADEPSHTMAEYLSPFFYEHFRQLSFDERPDFPSCEQINGDTYPCYLFVKAEKLA